MSLLTEATLVVTPNANKEGKLYSVIPSNGNGDFTVTRATTATRTNSAGLIEVVPYNLLTWSEMFSDASWTKSGTSVTANTTTAPDGTLTADTLIENTANAQHQAFQSITSGITGANQHTATLFVKQYSTSTRNIAIRIQDNAFTYGSVIAVFNPSTGALVTSSTALSGVILSTSSTLINGFYRISVTFTIALSVGFRYDVVLYNGTNNTYLGDGTSGVYIWGAQINEGTTAKDYLRTETRLNIPRLDYSLGSCPNLLLEPQRTNLVLYSEQFDKASWTKSFSSITANATTAPTGNLTADKLVDNATLNQHRIDQTPTAAIGTYTFSVFLKKAEIDTAYLRIGFLGANFNLTSGTTSGQDLGVTSSIQSVGDGWYRCSITRTTTGANEICRINLKDSNNFTYLGNGIDGFFLWGAQLEAGAYATSYIPTTTASVTRNADVVQTTGASSLIGQTSGTIFIDLNFTNVGTEKYIASIGDSTFANFIAFRRLSSGEIRIIFTASTSSGTTNASSAILPNGNYKIGYKYSSGSIKLFINGALSFSLTPTFTFGSPLQNIKLGMDSANTLQLGDSIKSFQLYTTALTDTQLTQLTTL